ncbi:MAG: 3-deoxy-manno-octulosonate cytidylyltransferase [Candidatus Amulumruptor caecigallinarius]|nr:3-deoxy-manno-octulosonate cytidylyltransferase [Candidatus Amulumruptor caecigallinarius]
MKFLVLIPARYESTRFPGKPLAKICGEEMIVRVCKQVGKTGFPLAVATDNEEIKAVVENNGFRAVMTLPTHKSGTERVAEAYRNLCSDADVVINVQGDEPFILPEQIKKLANIFEKGKNVSIATLAKPFRKEDGMEALEDPNLVKVVFSKDRRAVYFSRNIIPFVRKYPKTEWLEKCKFYTHIGIYAYKADVLGNIVKLPESPLEKAESLEQLRWLENGLTIGVDISEHSTIGIDTPSDLKKAEEFLAGGSFE